MLFCMQGEDIHGVPGLVNLFGIESPGLTASMSIAEHVIKQMTIRRNSLHERLELWKVDFTITNFILEF